MRRTLGFGRADLEARLAVLERERQAVFENAQREADTMFAQYQLSQLLASGEELRPLASAVLAEIARATGAAGAALWLAEPGATSLELIATAGEPDHDPPPPAFGNVAAALGWAAKRGWPGMTLEETHDQGGSGVERAAVGFLAIRPDPDELLDPGHARYLALVRRELAITFRAAQLRSSLAQERATLAAILEGASDGIVAVDSDLRVVQMNAAAMRLLGIERARATGSRCERILECGLPVMPRGTAARPGSDLDPGRPVADPAREPTYGCRDDCPFAKVLATGRPIAAHELMVRARDRQPVPVAASFARTSGGPVGAVAVIRDLRPALALDRMKSSFVASVSHELRTPLALISGYAQSLLHLDLDPATTHRQLEQINEAVDRLTELVDQILDTSQIESDRLPLHRSAIDLAALIRSFAAEVRTLPDAVPIEVAIAGSLPLVDGDAARIRQVLANLTANSAKYAGPGARVHISARSFGPRTVVTTVADDGVGIDPAEQDEVFDRFYRGRAVRESPISGSGLGLYLARRLVESHGGWIRLDATVRGTSISFGLPVAEQRTGAEPGALDPHSDPVEADV
jgi:signal transduction histidine kinase